ncbi:MAG TPA: hypothetical protein VLC28_04065, partial [Flavitalea sp.]|nr:hypothetical protein [Flavitalea sp.]
MEEKDKGQRTKDKGQRTKDKGQRTEDRGFGIRDKLIRAKGFYIRRNFARRLEEPKVISNMLRLLA